MPTTSPVLRQYLERAREDAPDPRERSGRHADLMTQRSLR
jgi:hypothetical protein